MSSNYSQSFWFWNYSVLLCSFGITLSSAFLFYTRGSAIGFLAAVAIPLDLPNRNVYMAFNFESNYALPLNDSYKQWVDRWDLDQHILGIGGNVTPIDGRSGGAYDNKSKRSIGGPPRYTRHSFYRSFVHYLEHFGLNGSACLLRTICEVSASPLDAQNGLLGSILQILFIPTTSAPESYLQNANSVYEASWHGTCGFDCADYSKNCDRSVLDMISVEL
ncbi:uncharacterized protein LOC115634136 [Scaptodrosophila lebanonensis]|uniref:Uncharacterized protein LOC115634136 n=1 Tax=Drosophila lebanonensis TaxID=7225 RepID=A0A6J2UGH5_DROLE|nr:uncharacterized protein LOC115634136 [Scaptodrosophila lebanonensis]